MILDLEHLLATNEHFLLGPWLRDARSWGHNVQEADFMAFNARNQVLDCAFDDSVPMECTSVYSLHVYAVHFCVSHAQTDGEGRSFSYLHALYIWPRMRLSVRWN